MQHKSIKKLLFITTVTLLLLFPSYTHADPLDHWISHNQLETYDFYDITYGNNMFMAVGCDSRLYGGEPAVFTSPDGIAWTNQATSIYDSGIYNSGGLYGVAYGNNTFVTGQYGTALSSPDGITWTEHTILYFNWRSVTYGNNQFVAVGDNANSYGMIFTSPDGVQWTKRKAGAYVGWNKSLYGVVYGNDTYVAVGGDGLTYTSMDGVTWEYQRLPGEPDLYAIAYGNHTFVAVSDYTIFTSPDGITWTEQRNIGIEDISFGSIGFGKNTFIATAGSMGNPIILTSSDGVTWKTLSFDGSLPSSGVVFGNDTFVMVGANGAILQSDPLLGPTAPIITMKPSGGPPGTLLSESGTGFAPRSTATLNFGKSDSNKYSTRNVQIDQYGRFDITYTIPSGTPPGTYTWWGIDSTGVKSDVLRYVVDAVQQKPKIYGLFVGVRDEGEGPQLLFRGDEMAIALEARFTDTFQRLGIYGYSEMVKSFHTTSNSF